MPAGWRRFIGALLVALLVRPLAAGQERGPTLSSQQRSVLHALVTAVDTRSAEVTVTESEWPLHVLRASDGSHYVAFSLHGLDGLSPTRESIAYVRLANKSAQERSAVAEWLSGQDRGRASNTNGRSR